MNCLHLVWAEHGVSNICNPTRTGFGTKLINTLADQQLGGAFRASFIEDGMRAKLTIPLGDDFPSIVTDLRQGDPAENQDFEAADLIKSASPPRRQQAALIPPLALLRSSKSMAWIRIRLAQLSVLTVAASLQDRRAKGDTTMRVQRDARCLVMIEIDGRTVPSTSRLLWVKSRSKYRCASGRRVGCLTR